MKDYYYILGINRDATSNEIKKAYYSLSKKFHPDNNNGSKYFENMFKEILEAYEVLKDKSKKGAYDLLLNQSHPADLNISYNINKSENNSPQNLNSSEWQIIFWVYLVVLIIILIYLPKGALHIPFLWPVLFFPAVYFLKKAYLDDAQESNEKQKQPSADTTNSQNNKRESNYSSNFDLADLMDNTELDINVNEISINGLSFCTDDIFTQYYDFEEFLIKESEIKLSTPIGSRRKKTILNELLCFNLALFYFSYSSIYSMDVMDDVIDDYFIETLVYNYMDSTKSSLKNGVNVIEFVKKRFNELKLFPYPGTPEHNLINHITIIFSKIVGNEKKNNAAFTYSILQKYFTNEANKILVFNFINSRKH